jgi:glycosyltransferase involved in cell wall biosynthesis
MVDTGQPLRVLQLAPLFEPLRRDVKYGGIERVVMSLAAGLSADGHHSTTLALKGSEVSGELVPVGSVSDYAQQLQLAVEAAAAAPFDVVQVHRREFFEGDGPRRIKVLRPDARIVATLHGPPARVGRYYEPYTADAHFVFVSAAQAGGLPQLPGTVVRNAVDVGSIPFRSAPTGPAYLSYLGRVCEEKGVAAAIDLAGHLRLPLKIAGVVHPGDRAYFDEVVVPRLRPGLVEFLGPMDDSQKYELIGGSTAVALLPAYEDPCPLVAIEALATGTPVIGLARGGLPELVADGVTGLLAGDLPGLLGKVPGLVGLSRQQCRDVAAREFDMPRLVRDYVGVYRGTSAPSRARPR